MGRRIRWLGLIMVLCFALVIAQLVNIQFVQEHKLADSPNNPGNLGMNLDNSRGEILASDGTVLAESVRSPAGSSADGYPYDYVREYPLKGLYSDITGYDSILDFGKTDIEAEYDSYLSLHKESAQTLSQLLFREKLPTTTDNVTLTVEPKLQQAAEECAREHLLQEQGWRHRGAEPEDGYRARHVLEPHLRPQRSGRNLSRGRETCLRQLHDGGS